jgi:hypothetical protein
MKSWHFPDNGRGAIFCGTVLWCAVAFSFDLVSFQHAKEAALNAGLLGLCLGVALAKARTGRGFRFFLPLWLWLAWAVLSGFGTAAFKPYLFIEAMRIASLLFMASLCVDLLQDSAWRAKVSMALVVSGVTVAGLGLLQYSGIATRVFPAFSGYTQPIYSVFGNQAYFGGYLALMLPLSLHHLAKSKPVRRYHTAFTAILLAGLVLSGSRSAWLAALTGCLVAWPWRHIPFRRTLWTAAGIGGIVAGAVLLGWPQVEGRIRDLFRSSDVGGPARLWYWDGTLRMIGAAPVAGVGLGNYPYWSPFNLGLALWLPGGEKYSASEIHTVHAHNEPLEFAAETGLISLVFGVWMLLRLTRRRGPEWGGLAALLVFCLFNAGLHSAPHALAGLLLAGMLRERDLKRDKAGQSGSFAGKCVPKLELGNEREVELGNERGTGGWRWGFVLAAAILGLTHTGLVLLPSYLLRLAEKAHVAGDNALPLYERAVRFPYTPPETWEVYGMALLEAAQPRKAIEALNEARAGLDTGRLHLLRAMAHLELSEEDKAREALKTCVIRWPFHEGAWRTLDRLTPENERETLRSAVQRWGIFFDAEDAATSAVSTAP